MAAQVVCISNVYYLSMWFKSNKFSNGDTIPFWQPLFFIVGLFT